MDLSSYDEIIDEKTGQTKLEKSLLQFRNLIVNTIEIGKKSQVFLLLNKFDLLVEKINASEAKLEGNFLKSTL